MGKGGYSGRLFTFEVLLQRAVKPGHARMVYQLGLSQRYLLHTSEVFRK